MPNPEGAVDPEPPRTEGGLVGAKGDPGAGPGLSVAPNGLDVDLDETSPKLESGGAEVANGLTVEEPPIVPKGDAELEASLPNADAAKADVDV